MALARQKTVKGIDPGLMRPIPPLRLHSRCEFSEHPRRLARRPRRLCFSAVSTGRQSRSAVRIEAAAAATRPVHSNTRDRKSRISTICTVFVIRPEPSFQKGSLTWFSPSGIRLSVGSGFWEGSDQTVILRREATKDSHISRFFAALRMLRRSFLAFAQAPAS